MKPPVIRSILVPSPNRLLRRPDLMHEYGMSQHAAYDLLNRYGVKLGGGLYIKRNVLEGLLEKRGAL